MSAFFSRVAFSAAIIFGGTLVVSAQDVASLPDAVSSIQALEQCTVGSGAVGTCVGPTQTYLTGLAGQELPAEQFSQALADYVIALAVLAQANDACNEVDSEIADAIRLAASFATDPVQRAGLIEIGDTIGSCTDFQTASIAPVASPN